MKIKTLCIALALSASVAAVSAQNADEMARKLQDPLSSIKMLQSDNAIDYNTGNDDISYGFNIQPVYAIPAETFNFVLRGVFPVLGLAPESQKPIVGDPLPPGNSDTWGLADSQVQMFFSPKSEAAWKWGVGPIVSLKTRTDDDLAGAGWGGGVAGVLVGSFSENVSLALIGGHTEGEDNFSTTFIQPILNYNVPQVPGMAVSYNHISTFNHNTAASNGWTIPLGFTVSKMVVLQSGMGLNMGLGFYDYVEQPEGAADYTIKWSVALIFP